MKNSRDEMGASEKAGLSERELRFSREREQDGGRKRGGCSSERKKEKVNNKLEREKPYTNGIRRTKTRKDDSARDVEKEGQRKVAESNESARSR